MSARMRVLQCYVTSTVLHGFECWTAPAAIEKKFEAVEMWFLRRKQRKSLKDNVTKEEVLRRARTEKGLWKTIQKRQLELLGRFVREEENLVLTGWIRGHQ